jgi:hypothetical protein
VASSLLVLPGSGAAIEAVGAIGLEPECFFWSKT